MNRNKSIYLPRNCLNVFDYFVELALNGLRRNASQVSVVMKTVFLKLLENFWKITIMENGFYSVTGEHDMNRYP